MLKILKNQKDSLIDKLISWTNINTYSYNSEGLKALGEIITNDFAALGLKSKNIPLSDIKLLNLNGKAELEQTGDLLVLSKANKDKPKILLMGHYDTVFPVSLGFNSASIINENLITGPGVTDMKGGLIIIYAALKLFLESEYKNELDLKIVFNPDEEIGSIASKEKYLPLIADREYAFIFEPALDNDGTLAAARKGSANFDLLAKGKSAHAGRNFHDGNNAITALSAVINEINSLNNKINGTTINVGLMQGGVALNVVPDTALAKINIRYENNSDLQKIEQNIKSIITKHNNIDLIFSNISKRPAKKFTNKLKKYYEWIKVSASELDMEINWQATGGVCDGNDVHNTGILVVDTLGAIGGKIHTCDEYLLPDSIINRSYLLFNLLKKIAEKKGPKLD